MTTPGLMLIAGLTLGALVGPISRALCLPNPIPGEFYLAVGRVSLLRVGVVWVLEIGRLQLIRVGDRYRWQRIPR